MNELQRAADDEHRETGIEGMRKLWIHINLWEKFHFPLRRKTSAKQVVRDLLWLGEQGPLEHVPMSRKPRWIAALFSREGQYVGRLWRTPISGTGPRLMVSGNQGDFTLKGMTYTAPLKQNLVKHRFRAPGQGLGGKQPRDQMRGPGQRSNSGLGDHRGQSRGTRGRSTSHGGRSRGRGSRGSSTSGRSGPRRGHPRGRSNSRGGRSRSRRYF